MNIRVKLSGLAILAMFIHPAFCIEIDVTTPISSFASAGYWPATPVWIPENTCGPICGHTCDNYGFFTGFGGTFKYELNKMFINCTACASGYSLHEQTISVCQKNKPTTCYDVKVNICSVECGANTYCKQSSFGGAFVSNCQYIMGTDGSSKTVCKCAGTCMACPDGGKSYIDKNSDITGCYSDVLKDQTGTYVYSGTGASYDGTTCSYTN